MIILTETIPGNETITSASSSTCINSKTNSEIIIKSSIDVQNNWTNVQIIPVFQIGKSIYSLDQCLDFLTGSISATIILSFVSKSINNEYYIISTTTNSHFLKILVKPGINLLIFDIYSETYNISKTASFNAPSTKTIITNILFTNTTFKGKDLLSGGTAYDDTESVDGFLIGDLLFTKLNGTIYCILYNVDSSYNLNFSVTADSNGKAKVPISIPVGYNYLLNVKENNASFISF